MIVGFRIVETGSWTTDIDYYPLADRDIHSVLADVERAVSRLQALHPDKEFRIKQEEMTLSLVTYRTCRRLSYNSFPCPVSQQTYYTLQEAQDAMTTLQTVHPDYVLEIQRMVGSKVL